MEVPKSIGEGVVGQNDSIVIDLDFDDFDNLDVPSDGEFGHDPTLVDKNDDAPFSIPSQSNATTTTATKANVDDDDDDEPSAESDIGEQFKRKMRDNMTDMLWQSGRDKATAALNMYAKIDILRPYFDVEPIQVRNRLLASFVPVLPTAKKQPSIPGDLYGPCMVLFTLIAILLFQMKGKMDKDGNGRR